MEGYDSQGRKLSEFINTHPSNSQTPVQLANQYKSITRFENGSSLDLTGFSGEIFLNKYNQSATPNYAAVQLRDVVSQYHGFISNIIIPANKKLVIHNIYLANYNEFAGSIKHTIRLMKGNLHSVNNLISPRSRRGMAIGAWQILGNQYFDYGGKWIESPSTTNAAGTGIYFEIQNQEIDAAARVMVKMTFSFI